MFRQTSRYVDIRSGNLMVVTDLHGDGEAFDRYVETFLALRDDGEADRLIFLGDIVHGYRTVEEDASLDMILRIIDLQDTLGDGTVIMLLGNHEMPHIYGVSLAKGDREFTPRFEHMLGQYRELVYEFLKSLPFLVRTPAGILFSHAGPDSNSINRAARLRDFDHNALLKDADRSLAQHPDLNAVYDGYAEVSGQPYQELAKAYLAVTGPEDPRYSDLMRALFISERDHRFGVLWDFLFTQNDRGLTRSTYESICRRYLDAMSIGAPGDQQVCVSGHVAVPHGGYEVVNDWHFRLASATHANPREEGRFLLVDAARPIAKAGELIAYTHRGF